MENNLDKYFKDGLSEREFGFSDAYWLEAEKLLAAAERRRKRRLLFWWGGGAFAVLAVAMIWWLVASNPVVENGQIASGADTAAQSTISENNTSENMASHNGDAADNSGNTSITSVMDSLANMDETPAQKDALNNSQNKGAVSKNKNNRNRQFVDNQAIEPKIKANKKGILLNDASQLEHKKTGQEKAFLNPPMAENLENSGLENEINSAIKKDIPEEKSTTENFDRELLEMELLALKSAFVEGDFFKKMATKTTPLKKHSPWHFGISAGQLAIISSDIKIIGGQGGLLVQRDLNKGFFVATGLQYRRRSGSFEASKNSVSRNYRFGLEQDSVSLRPTSLHYISVPLQLGWQKGHHVMETGFSVDYLLGMRGELGQYERTDLPPFRKVFTPQESGWIVEDGYKKMALTAMFGYRYRVNTQLSFGVSGNYTIGGILDKKYNAPIGGFLLKEADKFYLETKVVYYLK